MDVALPRVVIGGLGGGCGKTFVSMGVVRALRDRGRRAVPFKRGPDYVDAAWLARAAGATCRNLDVYLVGEEGVVASLVRHGGGAGGMAVIEGARGLYDSVQDHATTSTAYLARLLGAPVVLVVDCAKVTRTVAAMVYGCRQVDPEVDIAGVVLNRVANARHEANVRDAVGAICGLPVLGAIPRIREMRLPERHLGLTMPEEHGAAEEAVALAADAVARYVDLDALAGIAARAARLALPEHALDSAAERPRRRPVRVGVVRDSAFTFYYPENLEALEACGAEIVEVSATRDAALPGYGNGGGDGIANGIGIDALYIGGGFPETHAGVLAANRGFAESFRAAVGDGLPVYAECGGAIYAGRTLRIGDAVHEMAGVLPLDFVFHDAPQGHGYTLLEATGDNPFFDEGVLVRGHEFHYTAVAEWPRGVVRAGFRVHRGRGFDGRVDGACRNNLVATYAHVHAGGCREWAAGIVRCATRFAGARDAGVADGSGNGIGSKRARMSAEPPPLPQGAR